MHPTHNTLSEDTRTQVIEVLGGRLVDVSDLYFQAKTAHWNVKGPNFIALHKLFDKVAEGAAEWTDLIAERIVQLGGTAEGTVQVVAERTNLEEFPLTIVEGRDHVEAVSSALAKFGELVREDIDKTEDFGDKGTSDLLTEVVRDVDKLLWFVEAHLGEEMAAATKRSSSRAGTSRR